MTATRTEPRSIIDFGLCLIGPTIWAVHLIVLYGAHAVICARMAMANPLMSSIAWSATALALLGLGAACVLQWRHLRSRGGRQNRFLGNVALMLSGLSALAIVWALSPVTLLPACAL